MLVRPVQPIIPLSGLKLLQTLGSMQRGDAAQGTITVNFMGAIYLLTYMAEEFLNRRYCNIG